MKKADKLLIRALKGETLKSPPIWLMRQAGRYLPEYRGTRAAAGSFLDLCYNPVLATEVTLQPIRRFGFDAAILFSDILVVADALGQKVGFEEGRGPVLEALKDGKDLAQLGLGRFHQHLGPVYETVVAAPGGLADGDDADRLCRRALDGGVLHDRRRVEPGLCEGQGLDVWTASRISRR